MRGQSPLLDWILADERDDSFYNKTPYSGLETHITNSYTNSLLQALHYLRPIRTLAKSHTFEACPKENCLLCEAGFLFRMLEDAKGMNCQASNFSRAFGSNPQSASDPFASRVARPDLAFSTRAVAALGLIDHENDAAKSVAYATLIQTFNRYLLEQMTTESVLPASSKSVPPQQVSLLRDAPDSAQRKPPLAQLVKLETHSLSTCQNCLAKSDRETSLNVVDLVYPRKVCLPDSSTTIFTTDARCAQAMSNEAPAPNTFSAILAASITRETVARLPCSSCRQNTHVRVRRAIPDMAQLPPVFVVNAGVRTADELELWMDKRDGSNGTKRFLPSRFTLSKSESATVVVGTEDSADGGAEGVEYELRVRPEAT